MRASPLYAIAGFALTVAAANAVLAQEPPRRCMPYLCRDAVVREGAERVTLIAPKSQASVTVVVGVAPPGPMQAFNQREITSAATAWISWTAKLTGAKCVVARTPREIANPPGARVFISAEGDPNPGAAFPELQKADAHGFVVAAKPGPAGTDLHLVGATGPGAMYAVWFFLVNYAGVRIVMPGDLGEVYAARDGLDVPKDLYVFNPGPDFLLRIWSGPGGVSQQAYMGDWALTQRFEYHHNMFRIYDVKRFGQDHPDYYPVVEGKPKVPDPKSDSGWQPTFSSPAVAARAIEYADEAFGARPDLKSISLSPNDGGGYSETDMRLGKILPDGRVSLSNIYYAYVNAVAKGIRAKWPDRYVATLPYGFMSGPPDFALEDNVVVFLLNEPIKGFKDWDGRMKSVGIYQWLYGMGWLIPNHWPRAMQEYLRWARAHGCKAFKGEAYPAWAQDGPKMWVLSNLLWNADADVDALLKDYYEHAYGPEAAPAMARYFAQAERIYERRRTPDEFKITYWHPGEKQFAFATEEDFRIMSEALAEAERLGKGENARRRIDLTTRCFRWAEFYWKQYAALKRLKEARAASEADVAAALDAASSFFALATPRDKYYKEQIETQPQFCAYSNDSKKTDWAQADPGFTWSDMDASIDAGFSAVSAFKRMGLTADQAAAWWDGVGRKDPALKAFADTQRLQILFPGRSLRNLLSNPSFEEPAAVKEEAAKDWKVYHNRMINATVGIDRQVRHEGEASVTAKGITDYSGVMRLMPLKNGRRYRLSFWYRTGPDTAGGSLTMMISPNIREPLQPSPDWTRYERVFTVYVPALAPDAPAGNSLLLTLRRGGAERSQIWFDDVRLEMLAPEGVEAASPSAGKR